MNKEYLYMIVEDIRTGNLYLDHTGTMIRDFEKIKAQSDLKKNLLKRFPTAGDLTKDKKESLCS